MGYNLFENEIKLREYGRNVQLMVEHAKTLKDDKERNALVHEIVRIMVSLNPNIRENQDYLQKLWDHLYHIADYELEVETDFPNPQINHINAKPEKRMDYHKSRTSMKAYGQNVLQLIKEAILTEDPEKKLALVATIGNIMKMNIKNSERDSNSEAIVLEHLKTLSKGKLDYQPEEIPFYRGPVSPLMPGMPPRSANRSHSGNGNGKKKKKKKTFFR